MSLAKSLRKQVGKRPAGVAGAVVGLALVFACGRPTASPPADTIEPSGTVWVEELARGSAVAVAGVAVGDRLVGWRRGDASGAIDSWDDLARLEYEQAQLGTVRLTVERAGRTLELDVPEDHWRAKARPALEPQALAEHRKATAAIAARDAAAALARYAALASSRRDAADRAWAEIRALELSRQTPELVGGESDGWARALTAAQAAGDSALEGWVAVERCVDGGRLGDFAAALEACARARVLAEERGEAALSLHARTIEAHLFGRKGELRGMEDRLRQVIAELETIAPRSYLANWATRGLARAMASQDDFESAFELARKAAEATALRAPLSVQHQEALGSLAVEHWRRDELAEAETRLAEARAILEAIDPRHDDLFKIAHNAAMVAADQGDLARAERGYEEALAMVRERSSDPLSESRIYNNLGVLAARRGDLATALDYDRRVLALREKLTPDSLELVTPLLNLGDHSERAGDAVAAVGYLERALALQRRFAPGNRSEAQALLNLGEAQVAMSDTRADSTLAEAYALARRVAKGSVIEARTASALGARRMERGDFAGAEALYRVATATFARLTPGTADEALALYELGLSRRRSGRPEASLAALFAAAAALDQQLATLGGTDEIRARFRDSWRHVYAELADLLRELGRVEEAYQVLERARARAFLQLVQARGIDIAANLPPELADERRRVARELSRVQRALEGATDNEAETRRLLGLRRELHLRRDGLAEQVGQAAPRLATLGAAFGVEEARASLGADVTAVSFSVGQKSTVAWIVGPGRQFEVRELAIGETDLRDLVGRFRLLLETRSMATDPRPLASELYQRLVAPWAEAVRTPALLVVPDGPLHHLPFGALLDDRASASAGRYLVEWKSLQFASSITAWAELGRRKVGGDRGAVAFADPSPEPKSVDRRWEPLPHGRREAQRVASLLGEGARAYVGGAATEAAAKSVGSGASVLHFATHAWVDPTSPLDSALVLAPVKGSSPSGEDGLLQAWEVLQELDLDAALVVLSGCETGSGALVADEGMLGLTRAFQFAGARAVIASLWPVRDKGTAWLMERFYIELTAGAPADRALRTAQLAALKAPESSHPSTWAAFQLYGAAGGVAQEASTRPASPRRERLACRSCVSGAAPV